ncbi:hypothetical protein ACH5RR_040188 [Cinchona calisaya]|uniref:EF-hand domain-containing protein n=1 Tax=Cinchona calisaya TaxID=153742 RepID=A0ABD2XT40_9GENT
MPPCAIIPQFGERQLSDIFKQHDKNGDRRLDRAELKEAFKQLGAMIPSWRAARALHHADLNGDGYIDEEEMTGLVNYALRLGYTFSPLMMRTKRPVLRKLDVCDEIAHETIESSQLPYLNTEQNMPTTNNPHFQTSLTTFPSQLDTDDHGSERYRIVPVTNLPKLLCHNVGNQNVEKKKYIHEAICR